MHGSAITYVMAGSTSRRPAGTGHDLRGPLRGGASDQALRAQVASVWTRRADRYSELRSLATRPEQKVEMSHIGG